jgi:hypothetical protein
MVGVFDEAQLAEKISPISIIESKSILIRFFIFIASKFPYWS